MEKTKLSKEFYISKDITDVNLCNLKRLLLMYPCRSLFFRAFPFTKKSIPDDVERMRRCRITIELL